MPIMSSKNAEYPAGLAERRAHEVYMRRAIELARIGSGNVSPNPLVGSVAVYNDRVIGEGWHKQYGGPHAEVNAIEDVKERSLLKDCTLYVNLEPCSHTGKTPPCADMIIGLGIQHVVVANQDPNPVVAGNGIRKMREAGIRVTTGILAHEAYQLNRRFFTYMQRSRPHIILKWAETADGFIARENYDSRWISDEYSRQLVHKWRAEEDAILVGSGTARHDNPSLNVRNWTGRDPVRVVIDRHLRLHSDLNLFDRKQRTICYNLAKDEARENLLYVKVPESDLPESIVKHLFSEKIQSVIVEGGAQILKSFIEADLWDEARIFISPKTFEKGIPAPAIRGKSNDPVKLSSDWLRIIERVQ